MATPYHVVLHRGGGKRKVHKMRKSERAHAFHSCPTDSRWEIILFIVEDAMEEIAVALQKPKEGLDFPAFLPEDNDANDASLPPSPSSLVVKLLNEKLHRLLKLPAYDFWCHGSPALAAICHAILRFCATALRELVLKTSFLPGSRAIRTTKQ